MQERIKIVAKFVQNMCYFLFALCAGLSLGYGVHWIIKVLVFLLTENVGG